MNEDVARAPRHLRNVRNHLTWTPGEDRHVRTRGIHFP